MSDHHSRYLRTCGADNGSIKISDVTGGDAPYEYSIDGGA